MSQEVAIFAPLFAPAGDKKCVKITDLGPPDRGF